MKMSNSYQPDIEPDEITSFLKKDLQLRQSIKRFYIKKSSIKRLRKEA
jgi:hypothetical protein